MDNDNPVSPEGEISVKSESDSHLEDFFFIPPYDLLIPRSFADNPVIDNDTGIIENYESTPGESVTGTTADPMPDVLESFEPLPMPEAEYEGFEIMEVE